MSSDLGRHMAAEITTQPELWEAAVRNVDRSALPTSGSAAAVIGCGTSFNMSMAWADLRERSGHGRTDAWTPTDALLDRGYDTVVVISRSGTTTEAVELVEQTSLPTVAIVGVEDSPLATAADEVILLEDADEESVVQTRFATTTLAVLRTHIGHDLTAAIEQAAKIIAAPSEDLFDGILHVEQVTFLGQKWVYALAEEAGLKLRESAQFWTEAYRSLEYRHGPISIASPGRLVWSLDRLPDGLADDIHRTGATLVESLRDPMAELVAVHRYALAIARNRGLDPDKPRSLTRSVILR